MAQKRDKEETELTVPENLPICTPPPPIPSPPMPVPVSRSTDGSDPKASGAREPRMSSAGSAEAAGPAPTKDRRVANKRPREATRCAGSGCKKRIGLVGFRCRCGDVFCSEHRYSDRHDCGYDYKAEGRAAIARENPVVRAAKLVKV